MIFGFVVAIINFILVMIFVPPVILGEIFYHWRRTKYYPNIEGMHPLTLLTEDNVRIQGWFTKSSKKLVIIVHGHADNSNILHDWYQSSFSNLGYDTLYIDLRNHGRSQLHGHVGLGAFSQPDVRSAIEWASHQSWEKIVLFGTSMGSIASLLSISGNSSSKPDILILDSTFVDHETVLKNNLRKYYIPKIWTDHAFTYLNEHPFKEYDFPDILDAILNIKIPIMVIHGDQDDIAPVSVVDTLNQLKQNNIVTRVIVGGAHSRLFEDKSFTTYIHEFVGGN